MGCEPADEVMTCILLEHCIIHIVFLGLGIESIHFDRLVKSIQSLSQSVVSVHLLATFASHSKISKSCCHSRSSSNFQVITPCSSSLTEYSPHPPSTSPKNTIRPNPRLDPAKKWPSHVHPKAKN